MIARLPLFCWAALAAVFAPSSTRAADLMVAAAADLKFALDELKREYVAAHPEEPVSVIYGSSGSFFAQIGNGAPFDLYLSADATYPRKLAEAGQALDDVFLYAIGRLVVWVPVESPLQPQDVGGEVLLDPAVRRVAVANPTHAPYGVAAVAALRSLRLYDAVEPKLVLGENVAQTAQFVQSGAADVGVIALSLALAPALRDKGRWWAVPLDAYPTMWQGGIVLRRTQLPERARAFRDFVLGPRGREVLARHGFSLP